MGSPYVTPSLISMIRGVWGADDELWVTPISVEGEYPG